MMPAEWMSAIYGVASAASWGAGDFCGGLATKRTDVFRVVVGSQMFGVVVLVAAALAFHDGVPTPGSVMWSGIAGLCGAVGLLSLYKALAVGRMGLAAPVSGLLSAALPVVAGGAIEGTPGRLRILGFVLALVGVWLVARNRDAEFRLQDLGLPVAAGLGFGCFIVIIAWASGRGVFWPLVAARLASLSMLTLVAFVTKQPRLPAWRHLPVIAASGVADAGGNAFLVLAAHAGRLDVAAVLSSLYPAATVLLAWFVLHERISRWQFAGLLAVLSAIVMISSR